MTLYAAALQVPLTRIKWPNPVPALQCPCGQSKGHEDMVKAGVEEIK